MRRLLPSAETIRRNRGPRWAGPAPDHLKPAQGSLQTAGSDNVTVVP
jgi:hypothetical protein